MKKLSTRGNSTRVEPELISKAHEATPAERPVCELEPVESWTPQSNVKIQTHLLVDEQGRYYASDDGRKATRVTLKQAMKWMAKQTRDSDGGCSNYETLVDFFTKVAQKLPAEDNTPIGELEEMLEVDAADTICMDAKNIFLCRKKQPPQYLTPKQAMVWIIRNIIAEEGACWDQFEGVERLYETFANA